MGDIIYINPYYDQSDLILTTKHSMIGYITLSKTQELLNKWSVESFKESSSFVCELPGMNLLSEKKLEWLTNNIIFHKIAPDSILFEEGDKINFDYMIAIVNIFIEKEE